MKKILVYIPSWCNNSNAEGIGSFVANVFHNIKGYEFFFLQFGDIEPFFKKNILSKGGKVVNKVELKKGWSGKRQLIKELISEIEHSQYDFLYFNTSTPVDNYVVSCVKKKTSIKIIIHSHSVMPKDNMTNRIKQLFSLFDKTNEIRFACSHNAAQWVFNKNVIKNNEYTVLVNGVDINKFSFNQLIRNQMRNDLNICENDFVIGHVGTLDYNKNQIYLVEIVKRLLADNKNVKLILIGDGSDRREIESKIFEYSLESNVILLGTKENINEYMQAFDCFLMPSLYEGFGLVAVEAQASGLFTVLSEGVPIDVVAEKEKVMFLPLAQIDEWVNVVSELAEKSGYNRDIDRKQFEKVDISNTALLFEKFLNESGE